MPDLPTPLRLTGAHILRDGRLQHRSIAMKNGRLTRGPLPAVDLSGYLVLPGIVDLHHTALHCPDARVTPETAIAEADRSAARDGVTTRYLSLPWSWERPALSPAAAERCAAAWTRRRGGHLTDLRLSLACETHMVADAPRLLDLVRGAGIAQVLFTDSTRVAEARREDGAAAFAQWAAQRGATAEALASALQQALRQRPAVPRHLCELAETFDRIGTLYGSVGDDTAEQREHFSLIGARLCVLPASIRAAAAARAVGDPVAASADSVARDRRRAADRIEAPDLLGNRLCDLLVSDRQSGAPLAAVRRLVGQGHRSLAEVWPLVSEHPARIMRLPDRGALTPGFRADLVILDPDGLRVAATLVAGRLVHAAPDIAARFRAVPQPGQSCAPMAAE
jgi:alpha-D-ribose 1-methylphosphonate 5-triphosphate diphosphatase